MCKSKTIKIKLEYKWKYNSDEYWPFNGMVNDLHRGIQAEENYLVALGLFAYSETIGWYIRGSDDSDGNNWACYKEFTEKYVGYDSISNKKLKGIFYNSRNGLAHRYFIKNKSGFIYNDEGNKKCGLEVDGDKINIFIKTYFRDFVKGVEKYLDEKYINNIKKV